MAGAKKKKRKRIAKKRITKKKRISKKTQKKAAKRAPKQKRLSNRELEKFKYLLLKEKVELDQELSHIANEALKKSQKEATGELSGYTYHMADLASDNYERDFSLSLATEEQKKLYVIEEALKRIRERSYGYCLGCGKRILKRRLEVVPHAAFCIKCQKSQETPK